MAKRPQAGDEGIVSRAIARPLAIRQFGDAAFNRRRIRKRRAFRQPLTHTRRADATGDEANRHIEALHQLIAQRRHETTHAPARARLRIVRELPLRAIKGRHTLRLRRLLLLAMIRRVRLPRDDKNLADTDMRHHGGDDCLAIGNAA